MTILQHLPPNNTTHIGPCRVGNVEICTLAHVQDQLLKVGAAICSFLLSTLDRESYIRFGIWSAICLILYLLFSLHSIEYHRAHDNIPQYK